MRVTAALNRRQRIPREPTWHSRPHAQPMRPLPTAAPPMHDLTADQLHQQHAYLEDGIALAMRRAGRGPDAVLERRMRGQARLLQAMLGERVAAQAVADVAEAACRVMDAADPEAPLRMLAIARDALARLVRRRAVHLPRAREAA